MDENSLDISENAEDQGEPGRLRRPPLLSTELRALVGVFDVQDPERSEYVARISRYLPANGKRRPRPEYAALRDAVQRCTNRRCASWPRYGGRGIRVCERWLGPAGFDHFWDDMGPRPSPQHSIDRIDNDGNYEPANCRWATVRKQNRNTRANHRITIDGETMCLSAWCERYGVPLRRTSGRLAGGWDPFVALTAPLRSNKTAAHAEARRRPARESSPGWGASAFRGVSLSHHRADGTPVWGAIVTVNGKQVWLGSFESEHDAARAYDEAALEAFGDDAVLNYAEAG